MCGLCRCPYFQVSVPLYTVLLNFNSIQHIAGHSIIEEAKEVDDMVLGQK